MKYNKELWNFIRTRVSNPDDAKDIMQDVLVKSLTKGRDELPWLYNVARNEVMHYARAKATTYKYFEEEREEHTASLSDDSTPELEYEMAQTASRLSFAYESMLPSIFKARALKEDGVIYTEMASILGITINSVNS